MNEKGKPNFQSLYTQKYKYGTFATDTSVTRKDRDLKRKLSLKQVLTGLLIAAFLLSGLNYFLALEKGFVFLRLGEEITCGEDYSRTKIHSLGINVYEYEGASADYAVVLPWGSEPEEPYTFGEEELAELNQVLKARFKYDKECSPESDSLPADAKTFIGLHIYSTIPQKSGMTEVCGIAAVCGYVSQDGQAYLLEEDIVPFIALVYDDNGTLRLYSILKYDTTRIHAFQQDLPAGMYYNVNDVNDITHAHQLCTQAAETAL